MPEKCILTVSNILKKISKEKKRKLSSAVRILFVLWIIWTIWSWHAVTERFTMDLPKETGEGVRIVLVTDLHSCFYGKGQHRLISMIDKEKPDIVLLGGDIFDDKLSDDNAKLLLEDLVTKYPCYYVTGNHEYWSERVDEMKAYLESIGVSVLEGECETVEINGATIDICGVDDPTRLFLRTWLEQLDTAYEQTDEDHIRILVTHRPEEVSVYEKYDYDLIVAGHAHAGQFRIPFINRGVFAPNQGYMAEYVSGTYELSNGSVMVVSRGLARESTPAPRYFNHPEIVVIDLE